MKKAHPSDLAVDLLVRSICAVQVAAVLEDNWGIFSWGWNSSGSDGMGEHAEYHCLRRANRKRAEYATIWVAAQRRRNKKPVTAKPCSSCHRTLMAYGVRTVWWRDTEKKWIRMELL
jgi:deoxycytidylate deaminase